MASSAVSASVKKWAVSDALGVFQLPLPQLMFRALGAHRAHHDPARVQISTLLSIKTGACPENCSYCPQSGYHKIGLKKEPLMDVGDVLEAAKRAKASGATRFCMGAAWRGPKDRDLDRVCEMVAGVKELGLETCATLGLLKSEGQAERLRDAGLDFYNHNIDCSKDFYHKIITTRRFEDRISTLEKVRSAGLKVCCGGIIGMGETNEDRVKMLVTLANLEPNPPESVPINQLIRIPGTPLANAPDVDPLDFVRTIATARILMPRAYIRLSAGREQMSDELQTLCFLAGANSFFYGEKLLTAANPSPERDNSLLRRLGLKGEQMEEEKRGELEGKEEDEEEGEKMKVAMEGRGM